MPLQLVDHRRGSASRYSWVPPFDWSVDFDNNQWRDEPRHYSASEPWFVQVIGDGIEIARVEFDDPGGINPEHVGVPKLGEERLEIQFIEVAAAATRRGIGTRVVEGLAELLPHQQQQLTGVLEQFTTERVAITRYLDALTSEGRPPRYDSL
nr:GNAT family N-acetyltransferase [Mycobacterium eburneum]